MPACSYALEMKQYCLLASNSYFSNSEIVFPTFKINFRSLLGSMEKPVKLGQVQIRVYFRLQKL